MGHDDDVSNVELGREAGENVGVIAERLIAGTANDHPAVRPSVLVQGKAEYTHGVSVSLQPFHQGFVGASGKGRGS